MSTAKKIVITGGSGRLGRYVVDRLKRENHITVIDTIDPDVSNVSFINGDILDLESMKIALTGADSVIHLAAIPNPRTSSEENCFKVNVLGTWTILQAAVASGIKRVIVSSSDSATGLHHNPKNWSPQYLPVDEDHPLRPSEVYSLTKEIAESTCRCFATSEDIEIIALRPAHIVFEPEYPQLDDRGSNIQNYHLWNFVAPEDVALAFDLALNCVYEGYECFYIGAADGLNERPTLELFRERFGFEPVVRKSEIYKETPNAGIFDITRARDKLGYKPQFNRKELLKLRERKSIRE